MQNSMTSTADLDTLINKIKSRDTNALSELYNLTKSDVFAFALSIVKNYHDAEDILHNVFITIFNSANTYISNNPKGWIITITKNLSLMKLRKDSKLINISKEEIDNISNIHSSFNDEDKLLVEYLLNNLKDEERKIVVLHVISGFKHKEISQILDIPLSTVLSKYNRSIKKLSTLLKEGNK